MTKLRDGINVRSFCTVCAPQSMVCRVRQAESWWSGNELWPWWRAALVATIGCLCGLSVTERWDWTSGQSSVDHLHHLLQCQSTLY